MALILVETPLQLLCGYEAYCHEEKNAKVVVRLTGRGRNDVQLLKMAETLNLEVDVLQIRSGSVAFDCFLVLPRIIKLLLTPWKVVYVGSWFSRMLKMMAYLGRNKEIFFLDDGMATLLLQAQQKDSSRKPPALFTFFDVEPLGDQCLIKHRFEGLASRFDLKGVNGNYFVGQPLVERGFASEDQYVDCLKSAINICNGENIVYIPHRVESDQLLEKIAALDGVSVLLTDQCVELHFYVVGAFPKRFFGCTSTSLLTVASMSDCTEVYSFHINNKRYEALPHLMAIYEMLKCYGNVKLLS